jgi:ferric-dicitrate binding protein FerR (iron transport regulator)
MPLLRRSTLLLVIVCLLSASWLPARAADSLPPVWVKQEQQYHTEQKALQQKEQLAAQAVQQAESARQYAIRIDDRQALPVADRALNTATRALESIRKRLGRVTARLAAVTRAGTAHDAGNVAVASRLYGKVQVKTAQGWEILTPETLLKPGQQIRTGKASRAELLFGDGTRVNLHANTNFMLESEKESTSNYRLSLGRGKAYMKKYGQRRFKIRTPNVAVAVRGTEFLVETSAAGDTALVVLQGEVGFSSLDNEQEVSVHSGQLAIMTAQGSLRGPESIDLKTLQAWWDD